MARSSDDSDAEDDFVVLGTPLPDLDPTEGTKKPTTIQDLTAKDKEGRRRFHGAFTGGYSAGYFNTVGSKEGFTPSTFVSSRSKKGEDAETNRPEDFMDDEDLEEHGIAPRKFATAGNFTSEERKRKLEDVAARLTQSSALDLGGTLTDLVVPEYLPIGIKLLRKMGWREGQGLGPRVKKKRSRRKESKKGASAGKKIYGCAMPPSESESEDSDSFVPANMSDLTFAPSDITPISLHAKDDVKGLGYRGLDPSLALPGSHVNLFGNPVKGKGKTGKGIRGHAFGVGALEDDDADIYAQDSLSNYDLTMRDGDDEDGNFGWTAPRAHGKQKVPVSYVGKLLEGFCLSSKPLQPRKNFLPPKLPPNFKPRHWSRRRKKEEEDLNGRQNKMTAVDRGLMLGETPIMSSVFDLVGSQDKSRIECTKEAIKMTRSLDTPTRNVPESIGGDKKAENSSASGPDKNQKSKFLSRFTEASDSTDSGDKRDSSVGVNAGTSLFKGSLSLQPFLKDPPKQARFDQFSAAVQQKVPDPYGQVSSSRLTEWERAKERDEFSRSVKLFRPMSAMMSSRFVHVAMLDDKNQDSKMEVGEEVPDEVKASDMRMFGKLTREEFEWHPDKLLCKRFNVPNPYPGSEIVGLPTVKRDKFSVFNFLSFGDYRPKEPDTEPRSTEKDVPKKPDRTADKGDSSLVRPEKKKATLSSIFKVLDDPDFHKPPTNSKSEEPSELKMDGGDKGMEEEPEDESEEPDVDLFRAIFKNSDSEDSEDEKSDKKEDDESMSDDEKKDENEEKKDDGDEDEQSVIPDQQHSKDFLNRSVEGGGDPVETAVTPFKPQTLDMDTDVDSAQRNSFSSTLQDASVKSPMMKRPGSRWGAGDGTKSVFSVLDEINQETHKAGNSTDIKDEVSDSEYGPALPPQPKDKTLETSLTDGGGSLPLKEKDAKDKDRESHRHHRHKEKNHKHKKDKKKKSKHKTKKEKRHKKGKKSSKSRRSKPESSGSEADSEISDDDDEANSSDASDKELLNRFMQVSKVKVGKS